MPDTWKMLVEMKLNGSRVDFSDCLALANRAAGGVPFYPPPHAQRHQRLSRLAPCSAALWGWRAQGENLSSRPPRWVFFKINNHESSHICLNFRLIFWGEWGLSYFTPNQLLHASILICTLNILWFVKIGLLGTFKWGSREFFDFQLSFETRIPDICANAKLWPDLFLNTGCHQGLK